MFTVKPAEGGRSSVYRNVGLTMSSKCFHLNLQQHNVKGGEWGGQYVYKSC